jgi:hypothetical protein
MPLQSSGPISFSQIANEFGTPPGKNLGAYRVSQSVGSLSNLPLDVGIPQSGVIKFSDFYNKKLNVVVDLHSIPDFSNRLTARSRYDNNNVNVIGGYKSRPSRSGNVRVIINVNRIIGSDKNSISNVAVRTGPWDDATSLELEIGPSGQIYGAGGNGGAGANNGGSGFGGAAGSSALGIDYPTVVINRGYIQAGSGGGGGGGWSNRVSRSRFVTRRRRENRSAGNGGGGGAGFPFGDGGPGGTGGNNNGNPGATSGLQVGGSGGSNGGLGGNGGVGGSFGGNGAAGQSGENSGGGPGGSQGNAIIVFNNGSGITINGVPITSVSSGGSINGPIIYNTNPT